MYRPTNEDMTFTSGSQKLSLREAAQFDKTHKLAERLTGGGRICKQRAGHGRSKRRAS